MSHAFSSCFAVCCCTRLKSPRRHCRSHTNSEPKDRPSSESKHIPAFWSLSSHFHSSAATPNSPKAVLRPVPKHPCRRASSLRKGEPWPSTPASSSLALSKSPQLSASGHTLQGPLCRPHRAPQRLQPPLYISGHLQGPFNLYAILRSSSPCIQTWPPTAGSI